MLSQSIIVARKEIVDHLRDLRSVISSLMYALMGPVVVFLVALTLRTQPRSGSTAEVLAGMMSVFTLVAAFVGGMNVAMDTIAGERERRSLLPLLLNPVLRHDIMIGKWLSIAVFSVGGLILNLLGFGVVFTTGGIRLTGDAPALLLALALGLLPLSLLAAALQLLISTLCRSTKESQTYLSMVVFAPMLIGMFLVFYPGAPPGWFRILPIAGQQLQLELLMRGGELPIFQPLWLGSLTTAAALLILFLAADRLDRDEIVYGN
jgi:sodium transport system permease protein